jgi:hypothetical protein
MVRGGIGAVGEQSILNPHGVEYIVYSGDGGDFQCGVCLN